MSSNLTGQPIADTYNQLLHIDGGPEATPKTVYSGTGTPTAFKLGTGSASIDNIVFNGSTISTEDANSNLLLSPSGSGSVVMAKVNITGGSIAGITDLAVADGGTGASDAAGARTNLGLGTMATQNANAVAITGGTIAGVTFSGSMTGLTLVSAATLTGTIVNGGNLRMVGDQLVGTAVDTDITVQANGTGAVLVPLLKATTLGVTNALGYVTGAGGAVTQITSKSTSVALNTICGQITMDAASMADGTTVNFIVTNTKVAATDVVLPNIASGATLGGYDVSISAVAAGSFTVALTNRSGGALAEAVVINFVIIKGVTA